MEENIISCLALDRSTLATLEKFSLVDDLTDKAKVVYRTMVDYYERDPKATSIDLELIREQVLTNRQDAHKELFNRLIDSALSQMGSTSPPNVLDTILKIKQERKKIDLLSLLTSGVSVEQEIPLLQDYLSLLEARELGEESSVILEHNVEETLNSVLPENLIRLVPDAINVQIGGGLLPGHHVLVFGRPDSGKTALALNIARGFIAQGKKVLFIGNEDAYPILLKRMLCTILDATEERIFKSLEKAQIAAQARGLGNFIVADLNPGSAQEVRTLANQYSPACIIVDQARNLHVQGEKNNNRVQSLEAIEREMREIGKETGCVTISVTQAGDSAEGKAILSMGDVDSSNTGMQASADFMFGMGVTNDGKVTGERWISFPKNKSSGEGTPVKLLFNRNTNRLEG